MMTSVMFFMVICHVFQPSISDSFQEIKQQSDEVHSLSGITIDLCSEDDLCPLYSCTCADATPISHVFCWNNETLYNDFVIEIRTNLTDSLVEDYEKIFQWNGGKFVDEVTVNSKLFWPRYRSWCAKDISTFRMKILRNSSYSLHKHRYLICTERIRMTNMPMQLNKTLNHNFPLFKVICEMNFKSRIFQSRSNNTEELLTFLQTDNDIDELVLSHNSLTKGLKREYLRQLNVLAELTLSHNQIQTFPKDMLWDLKFLAILNLHHNDLEFISPDSFTFNTYLQELNLRGNLLKTLNKELFRNVIHLKYLYLDDNQLSSIDSTLFHSLENLMVVSLSSNSLESLPNDTFQMNSKLEVVVLSDNQFRILDSSLFYRNTKLKILHLDFNKLQTITSSLLRNASDLIRLDISQNLLVKLPSDLLNSLFNLEHFDASYNKLGGLSEAFFRENEKLKFINLRKNQIISLSSEAFLRCENLIFLELSNNEIESIDERAFLGLSELNYLGLHYNKIFSLPDGLLRDLENVERIDLSYNQIEFLSDDIFDSNKRLRYIKLIANQLKQIPERQLSNLPELTSIHLEKNNLRVIQLPLKIGTTRTLNHLSLSHNCLQAIEQKQNYLNFTAKTNVSLLSNGIGRLDLLNCCITMLDSVALFNVKKSLDLRLNAIQYLDTKDLKKLILSNVSVDLSDNKITKVNLICPTSAELINGSVTINLNRNPLRCDCRALSLIQLQNCSRISVTGARCATPLHLENREVLKLRIRDFKCGSIMDCPDVCECYKDKSSVVTVNCSHRELREFPETLPKNVSVILHLENNKVQSLLSTGESLRSEVIAIYLSGNEVSEVNFAELPNLKLLDLSNNNLSKVSAQLLELLGSNVSVLLANNPWICSCGFYRIFHSFQSSFTGNSSEANCWKDGEVWNLNTIKKEEICNEEMNYSWIYVIIGMCLTAVIPVVLFLRKRSVKKFQKRFLRSISTTFDYGKSYDVFVSYSTENEDWVKGELIAQLESGSQPYSVIEHSRDWKGGEWIPDMIAKSVKDSRRTIIVLTKEFLTSGWCFSEFNFAHLQAKTEGVDRVVVIVKGELPELHTLPAIVQLYLTYKIYIRWEDKNFWKKLRYAISKPIVSRSFPEQLVESKENN